MYDLERVPVATGTSLIRLHLMQLWGGFGVLALLLVCVGLYGVVTQVTSRRTMEISE